MGPSHFWSDGYFTWLTFLLDLPAADLDIRLGYAPGTLASGWQLFSPLVPIAPGNIDLRGSTRWPDGELPDGRSINALLASRLDLVETQRKLSVFFDKGLKRRPVKVRPKIGKVASYPAAYPIGIPQFKLLNPIQWVALADVSAGEVLRLSDVDVSV